MILNYHKIHTEHFIHVINMIEVNMFWKNVIVWISWFIARLHLYIRKRFVHTLFPLSGSYSVFHISLLLLLGLLIQVYSILIVLSADGKEILITFKNSRKQFSGISCITRFRTYLVLVVKKAEAHNMRTSTSHYTLHLSLMTQTIPVY